MFTDNRCHGRRGFQFYGLTTIPDSSESAINKFSFLGERTTITAQPGKEVSHGGFLHAILTAHVDAPDEAKQEHESNENRAEDKRDPEFHESGSTSVSTPAHGRAKTSETAFPRGFAAIKTIKQSRAKIVSLDVQRSQTVPPSDVRVVLLSQAFSVVGAHEHVHNDQDEGRKEEYHLTNLGEKQRNIETKNGSDNATDLVTDTSADSLEFPVYELRFLGQRAAVAAQPREEIGDRMRFHVVQVPYMQSENVADDGDKRECENTHNNHKPEIVACSGTCIHPQPDGTATKIERRELNRTVTVETCKEPRVEVPSTDWPVAKEESELGNVCRVPFAESFPVDACC